MRPLVILAICAILAGGCRTVYYSTPSAGLLYVVWGDSKLTGVSATVGDATVSVDSAESEGKLSVPDSFLGYLIRGL